MWSWTMQKGQCPLLAVGLLSSCCGPKSSATYLVAAVVQISTQMAWLFAAAYKGEAVGNMTLKTMTNTASQALR